MKPKRYFWGMRKSVLVAIWLMTVCAIGISVLQLFYSMRSFDIEKNAFSRKANEAFHIASDSVFSRHTQKVAGEFRKWISDTNLFRITSRVNPEYHNTVFTIAEVDPSKKGQTQISMSLEEFTDEVAPITPYARRVFIDHLVGNAKGDLKKGFVFYYTQKLGDSLDKARYSIPIDTNWVRSEFRKQLAKRGISLDFTLNPKKMYPDAFRTDDVNFELKTIRKPRRIHASFANTGAFVLGQLKWAIFGSAILLLLTMFCFGYALKLLLTQQKLSAIKDDFINNMTHEISTPLASIIVTAEALRKFDHDDQSRGRYLDIILHQSRRLDALSGEILDSARLEKKGMDLKNKFPLKRFLVNAIDGFDFAKLSMDAVPDDFCLFGSENSLKRAVRNLMDNSVKYCGSQDLQVELSAKIEPKRLLISVSDNGKGIPDAEKKRIFEAFYRIPTQTHEVKGYGLGLHYVKQVAQNHGGSVSVRDNANQGATFEISIPI